MLAPFAIPQRSCGEQLQILLSGEEAETAIDRLETHFSQVDGFRLILLSVEASIPRPLLPQEIGAELKKQQQEQELDTQISRINRHELYEDVSATVILTWTHILMVLLSTVIAAIGLLRDDGTIIIGSMVIAPLLGPNMALSIPPLDYCAHPPPLVPRSPIPNLLSHIPHPPLSQSVFAEFWEPNWSLFIHRSGKLDLRERCAAALRRIASPISPNAQNS